MPRRRKGSDRSPTSSAARSSRGRTSERSHAKDDLSLFFISVWEAAKKVEKAQLVLDRPVDQWLELAVVRPGLHQVELTRLILVEGCKLPPPFHGDPTDQIIVATARDRDAAIITKDERICAYAHMRSVW